MANISPKQAFAAFISVLLVTLFILSIVTLVRVFTLPATISGASNGTQSTNNNQNSGNGTSDTVLNIPETPTISPTNKDKYHAYSDYSKRLHSSINTKEDPCTDFYAYSCENYDLRQTFFDVLLVNFELIAKQLTSNSYIQNAEPPVQQAAIFYNKCVNTLKQWSTLGLDGERVTTKMNKLMGQLDLYPFPVLNNDANSADDALPSPETLSGALSYLSFNEYVDTFLTISIETNWKNPHSKNILNSSLCLGRYPFALFVDQSTLVYPDSYYIKIWSELKPKYFEYAKFIIQTYADYLKVELNDKQLVDDVTDILDLEYTIATSINTPENQRRKFERSYNPYTLNNATQTFSLFNFDVLFQDIEIDRRREIIVKEPEVIQNLSLYLQSLCPRVVYNYLYFRLLYKNFAYLLGKTQDSAFQKSQLQPQHLSWDLSQILTDEIKRNQKKWNNNRLRTRESKALTPTASDRIVSSGRWPAAADDDGEFNFINLICVYENAMLMPYANGRAFLDAQYPRDEDRAKLKDMVGGLVANVMDAFQGMLAQLDWMSNFSKQGAFNKVANLVKNIAYPSFMANNTELNMLYADLRFDESNSYNEIVDQLKNYQHDLEISLLHKNDTDRLDFLASPSIINAWYDPSLNSITLPLAILQKPFFDINYPASVNFGGIGVVVGHELVHAFDDQGVQWDATGVLKKWIDSNSQKNFDQMARCVVDQYSGYEPLPGFHIDGSATQGENIADNGGIQAAYRAFVSYRALNGLDPQLPDSEFHLYTQDQLFFLNFGQIWCSQKQDEESLKNQLLVDPHSPDRYRVLGTLKNTSPFRNAFNCPLNSVYAPEDHCRVWISESKQVTGIPPTTTTAPPNNIPQQKTSQAEKYAQAAAFYENSIDTSVDPCDNFYDYACANYDGISSFQYAGSKSYATLLKGLRRPLNEAKDIYPLKQTKIFFNKCKDAVRNWDNLVNDGSAISSRINTFLLETKFTVPIFNKKQTYSWPTPNQLGKAVGLLSGQFQTDTLLTPFVDYDWVNSQENIRPYKLYVDQPTLGLSRPFYEDKTWEIIRDDYFDHVHNLFQRLAKAMNYKLRDLAQLKADVKDILRFEKEIATGWMTKEDERRNYKRSYNPINLANDEDNDKFKFVELNEYISRLTFYATEEQQNELLHGLHDIILMEPERLEEHNSVFTGAHFNARTLFNYLVYRLANTYEYLLPGVSSPLLSTTLLQQLNEINKEQAEKNLFIQKYQYHYWNSRLQNKTLKQTVAIEALHEYELVRQGVGRPVFKKRDYPNGDEISIEDYICGMEANYRLTHAASRIHIDEEYPIISGKRELVRRKVGEITANIMEAFKAQVSELTWFTDTSRVEAYSKIRQIVANIAYPDFITDDSQLIEVYKNLKNFGDFDYLSILNEIFEFDMHNLWAKLQEKGIANRTDFVGPTAEINAWYYPALNSITFPAAILQQPFFDIEWPSAINYGGIGHVAGHELTHGFDDEGIQWNAVGELKSWLDDESLKGFKTMANCVVEEYNKFCPLDADLYQPNCVNGYETQGENIADNGGIHAAYNAYKLSTNFNGQDPRLPGALASQFTHDQLFFLNFAQLWCQPLKSAESQFSNLLLNPHSPARYRIWGTLQNFVPFRTTFNCPAGKQYTPVKHCNVWMDKVKPITPGVPSTTTTLPPLNIQAIQQSNKKKKKSS